MSLGRSIGSETEVTREDTVNDCKQPIVRTAVQDQTDQINHIRRKLRRTLKS